MSPPAATALHQKASDDAQGNSQPVGAHCDVRVQQPPSHNRFHSAPQQKRRGCFICQDTGHFARACPLNNGNNPSFRFGATPNHVVRSSGQAEQNGTPPPHMYMSRGAGTKMKDEYVYIDIDIDGKTHLALLDSGCQISLIPPSLVGSRSLQPSVDHLLAANSSPIHILGTVELPVNIGGRDSVIKMLVTLDVREPMLSLLG